MNAPRRILLAALLVLSACKTTAPVTVDGENVDGRELMGLGDRPLAAIWEEWTPSVAPSTPSGLATESSAFDYWQVTEEPYINDAWAAVSTVVSSVRNVTDSQYDPTFRTLMTVLEEGDEARRLDLTFVASLRGTGPAWEGVIARVYREMPSGAAPGVSVLLRRWSGGSDRPDQVVVWFFSGFDEAPSLTAVLSHDGRGWRPTLTDGIATEATAPMEGNAGVIADVLAQVFWNPVTQTRYLDDDIARRPEARPVPAPQPIAAGLVLGNRDIDQVFSDSVFVPRLTSFPSP